MSDMKRMKQITDSRKAELFDSAMDYLRELIGSRTDYRTALLSIGLTREESAIVLPEEDDELEERLVYEYEMAMQRNASRAEMDKIYSEMKAVMERFGYSGVLYEILVDDGQLPRK